MTTTRSITTENNFQHLRTASEPLTVKRDGRAFHYADEDWHARAYEGDAELYALMSIAERVDEGQQARVLLQLLGASRATMAAPVREVCERVTNLLMAVLPADEVLQVFLALRRRRANHKHTARAILNYILNHPCLEALAVRRRAVVADCLAHALGKNVARACAKLLASADADSRYAERHLLSFARDRRRTRAVVPFIFRNGSQPAFNSEGDYTLSHIGYVERLTRSEASEVTVTATNRGDIAATLVHIYRGGASDELLAALKRLVDEAAQTLPYFDGKLALVLDLSASTQSYGSREYGCISQSVALQLLLEQRCREVALYPVGGNGVPPKPEGDSDLAGALLAALTCAPDLVAIVSDGYENHYPGELAAIVAALPQAGITTPIVYCHSKFTGKDDLELRRPVAEIPQLEFWHQYDFEDLMLSLFSFACGQRSSELLREFLRGKLGRIEKEVTLWTTIN